MTFIRQAELLIGPLTEAEGGGPSQEAYRIFSQGSDTDIRVRFSIDLSATSEPNKIVVAVSNLATERWARMAAKNTLVQLSVSYQGESLKRLARGGIASCTTRREGDDRVTVIEALDGYGPQARGILNRTYGGGMPLRDVFRDLARSLPGIDLGSIDVSGNLPPKGVHASGRVAETLNWLADRYGVTWSIQGGVLQVIKDGQGLPGEALVISSRNRNLKSISPTASGPDAAQNGVEIIAQLDASIRPGSVVYVDSHDQPNLTGFYVAQSVNASGDTHGDDWTMTIRSTSRQ
jgi:hypothetical protein